MKCWLILLVVTALAAFSHSSVIKAAAPRANLSLGYTVAGDRLLFSTYLYRPARPNTIQYQDVMYRGNATTRITVVRATEVGPTQYAAPAVLAGGLGFNNVTVRVTSARGYGYYYYVDVWGR